MNKIFLVVAIIGTVGLVLMQYAYGQELPKSTINESITDQAGIRDNCAYTLEHKFINCTQDKTIKTKPITKDRNGQIIIHLNDTDIRGIAMGSQCYGYTTEFLDGHAEAEINKWYIDYEAYQQICHDWRDVVKFLQERGYQITLEDKNTVYMRGTPLG
jgi:hypothetical protein